MVLSPPLDSSWKPRDKDVKRYFHFDRRVSPKDLEDLANDRPRVAKHAFFPFLRYTESWIPYRGKKLAPKKRPIRYSARRDAAIFAKYRSDISTVYESHLAESGYSDAVIAYRKMRGAHGQGKTNIDFAKEAFDFVRAIEKSDCYVIDISSFFESLDHKYLRQCWIKLKGENLSPDEEAVFRAVTHYSVVDLVPLFERLNLRWQLGDSNIVIRETKGRKRELRKLGHSQICSHPEFLEKVCGKGGKFPSLIQRHRLDYGIPQGLPISDIFANIYLMAFDDAVNRRIRSVGGLYMRYSDDILVILPSAENFDVINFLRAELNKCGSQLNIKSSKISHVKSDSVGGRIEFTYISGANGRNGLEYLGFRYDGLRVFIREKTTANLHRKFLRRARGAIAAYVRRYRQKSDIWLNTNFYGEKLLRGFVRTIAFSEVDDPRDWTFFSYASKAHETFAGYETGFSRQLRNFKRWCRQKIDAELKESVAKR